MDEETQMTRPAAITPAPPELGIIGGMGPAATTNFVRQLDELSDAESDQEHLAYIVWGDPRVPDRSAALLGRGPSPLPHLSAAVTALSTLGVRLIAMPCNTAHHWIDELSSQTTVPIVDMIAATAERTAALQPGARVCILATLGTASSPLYRNRLTAAGLQPVDLDTSSQELVEGIIRSVKAQDLVAAREGLERVEPVIARHDVDVAIIACTDLSYLVAEVEVDLGVQTVDASEALARSCLEHLGHRIR